MNPIVLEQRASLNFAPRCVLALLMFFLGAIEPGNQSRLMGDETPIAEIDHPDAVDFQREILPLLRKKCLACHNGTDAESDLVLESPATILQGGLEGPAVVAGAPDESRMLVLASGRDEPVMPPEDNDAGAERMTSEELGLLKRWIEQGAQGVTSAAAEPIQWQALPSTVNPVFAAAQSADGRYIVAGRANQAWTYDVLLGEYVGQLIDPSLAESPVAKGHPLAHLDLVQSIAMSRDGNWIASGGYRTVKLWRRVPAVEPPLVLGITNLTAAVTSPSDRRLYFADESGTIRVHARGAVEADGGSATIVGSHGSRVQAVAVAPHGKLIASSGEDNAIRIWTIEGHAAGTFSLPWRVHQLVWLADNLLAGNCDDHSVRIWPVDPAGAIAEPRQLTSGEQQVVALAPLANQRLATASSDGSVRIWNVESGELQKEFNHGGPVIGLAGARTADRLVTFAAEGPAKLWNTESGQPIAELSGDVEIQWQLEQRHLAQQIAQRRLDNVNADLQAAKNRVAEEEDNLKKVREARDKAKSEFEKADGGAAAAASETQMAQAAVDMAKAMLVEAEKAVANAADDVAKQMAATQVETIKNQITEAENALKAKTEASEKAAKELAEHKETFETSEQSVVISEQAVTDAKAAEEQWAPRLATTTELKQAADQAATEVENRLQSERHLARLASISDDGRWVASIDGRGRMALWRATDGRAIQIESIPAINAISLAWGPDQTVQALTADGQLITVHRTGKWQLTQVLGAPDDTSCFADRITSLSFSPDDQLLAIGGGQPSRGGELKIYRIETEQFVQEIAEAHSDTIFGLAFSPDGQQLASCAADRFMKIFDVATGQLVRTFEGHTHHVLSVAWRADGRMLATGGADSVVKVWNAIDGSQAKTIDGFGKEVTSVQFAGAENHFYAACGDRQLYRCNTEGERKSIGSGQDFLYVVSANLLGKSVAFAGHDSIVRVIDDNGGALAELKPAGP